MTTSRGVFRKGEFKQCGGLPRCAGRAINGAKGCTCGAFTAEERATALDRGWSVETRMEFDSLQRWGRVLSGGCP